MRDALFLYHHFKKNEKIIYSDYCRGCFRVDMPFCLHPLPPSGIKQQRSPSRSNLLFADTLHDFGTFPADSARREYVFRFTNTGDGPVAVVDVAVSCRCLSAEYTRTVVRPGESGQVTLVFDGTKSARGYFDKSARVRFNSPRVYTLRVRGQMK